MYLLSLSRFFTCLLTATLVVSLPLAPSLLKSRLVNCSDLGASFDQTCWITLDVSDWLNNPKTGWNKTTPVCTATEDDAACCIQDEPWTTCFLRLIRGRPDEDCSMISARNCPPNLPDRLDPNITAQEQYVMKNIYGQPPQECYLITRKAAKPRIATKDFFTTWFESIGYATTQALTIVQPVITELDPIQTTNFLLHDILTALSFGLAFIARPEVASGVAGIEAATTAAAKAFVTGLQNAPAVAQALWPSGTSDSQSIQISGLESELSHITANLSRIVDAGLRRIMTDVPSFIAFASTGAFSGPTSLSLPATAQGLDLALRTYLLSGAMAQNRWQATGFANVTREQVQSSAPGAGGWACTLDANDICVGEYGGVFYSASSMRAFSLSTTDDTDITPLRLMNDIVDNGWSTLPLLFDGAYDCAAAGNSGTTPFAFRPDGGVDLSCMSQLRMCIACGSPCPVDFIDGACPFAPCQRHEGFF